MHNVLLAVSLVCVVIMPLHHHSSVTAQQPTPDHTTFVLETYFPDVIISYASCTDCPASDSVDLDSNDIGGSWCRAKPTDPAFPDTYTCGTTATGPRGEMHMWAVANILKQHNITSFNGKHVPVGENWKRIFYSKL